jgi:hypothetical protein
LVPEIEEKNTKTSFSSSILLHLFHKHHKKQTQIFNQPSNNPKKETKKTQNYKIPKLKQTNKQSNNSSSLS